MESSKSNLSQVEMNWDIFFKSAVFIRFETAGNSLIQSDAFEKMDTQSQVFREFKSASYALVANLNLNLNGLILSDNKVPSVKTTSTELPPRGLKMCSTFVGNSTSLMTLWKRVAEQFDAMFRRKAFLHWYADSSESESAEAESQMDLNSFVQGYLQYQGGISQ